MSGSFGSIRIQMHADKLGFAQVVVRKKRAHLTCLVNGLKLTPQDIVYASDAVRKKGSHPLSVMNVVVQVFAPDAMVPATPSRLMGGGVATFVAVQGIADTVTDVVEFGTR